MVELGSKKRLKYLFLVFLAIVSLFLVPTVAYYYYPTTYCQYNWDPYDPTVLPDWNDPADIARGQANPEAPMEGGKKAPECTFLKINAYDPEGTVKSQSDTSTAQCNIYYTAVCSDDTAGFWHEHGTATVAGSTRYFTNPFELQWSVMNTVCAIGGLEGYYDFENGILLCDRNQIKQVFINLIKNAFESMPDGGTLTIESKHYNDKNIKISIKDTGIGMPQEIVKKMGQPFFTTKEGRIGLGVMLSKQIIKNHNGSVQFWSDTNGTSVEIILPISLLSLKK